jgi:hypothetical protein
MEWQQSEGKYTLQRGTCEATVWHMANHGYGAMVKHAGVQSATYGYETLESAQAWCITRLAELRRSGERSENSKSQ